MRLQTDFYRCGRIQVKIRDNEFVKIISWTERRRKFVRLVYREELRRLRLGYIRDDQLSPRAVIYNLTELIYLDQRLGTSFEKLKWGHYYND